MKSRLNRLNSIYHPSNLLSALLLSIFLITNFSSCIVTERGYTQYPETDNENIFVKSDDIEGVTFYRHKSFFTSAWSGSQRYDDPPIEIYISEQNNVRNLRIVIEYNGSSWIFFDSIILANDTGKRVFSNINEYDKTTDVYSGGKVMEMIDLPLLDSRGKEILNLIDSSENEISLRLKGKYQRDFKLSENLKFGLKDILDFYFNS